jgi:hypothetical protein
VDGPLTGVRVTDFGQYVAGELAAVLLADQGAFLEVFGHSGEDIGDGEIEGEFPAASGGEGVRREGDPALRAARRFE